MILGNITSIILYILVFVLAALLLYFGEKRHSKWLIILAFLPPILLATFRYQVGTDWIAYNQFYEEVAQEDSAEFWRQIRERETEPLMMFIGLITSTLRTGSWPIFLIYSSITLIFMYLAMRRLAPKHTWLVFTVFLFTAFPDSFNIMRQMAAMSVLAYLYAWIATRRPVDTKSSRDTASVRPVVTGGQRLFLGRDLRNGRAMTCVTVVILLILAINLHYATLALLPILLIPYLSKKFGEKKISYALSLLLIVSLLLFPLLIQLLATSGILSPKHYETLTNDFGSFYNFNFLICIVLGAFSFFYFRKKPTANFLTPLILLGANYAAVGFYSRYLGRLADFFWPFAILLAWQILDSFKISLRLKIILTLAAALLYFFIVYVWLGTNEILPYGFAF